MNLDGLSLGVNMIIDIKMSEIISVFFTISWE